MHDLPKPDDLRAQFEAGQIDQAELFKHILDHLTILYHIKKVDLVLLNGLLRDMAAVTAELGLERPSEAVTQRLKDWAQQVYPSADHHPQPAASEVEADADGEDQV
jgi:hypothetical protein